MSTTIPRQAPPQAVEAAAHVAGRRTPQRLSKRARHQRLWFFIFISPWLAGFLIFTIGPMIYSFVMSFTNWSFVNPGVEWVGLDNYRNILVIAKDTEGARFYRTLLNTLQYGMVMVPINLFLSLILAYLLSFKVKGQQFFRTVYYLPAIVPVVASVVLFQRMLAKNGLINDVLALVGIDGPSWLTDQDYVVHAFVIMALWGIGANMILLLSAINGIGPEMYESATLDGANRIQMFWAITIPQITPIIFFNLITGIIGSLQVFTQVYMVTADFGGYFPDGSSMVVPLLFNEAFRYGRAGSASAMAWVLFALVLLLALLIFKSSKSWVFYEEDVD
ncbi:MAG TPA: sugar ABC transporter permease [Arachnia sp.]|nr:sugar ABC transporter permease [Arachnia sp.]HMT84751.1 sugar ABC transporter permease [Arachnia sp.]